ncbi:hypothetical protein [Flexivirga oryzae]|uniref:N-acetyltransferase domain-containing protein n=1 Tax=Flexivirga oryzae TaxID=1794944 RepID=A0A839MZ62_9MICO|nr:hypothetical protein [Flexivirga oryzae]MBB2890698.1 hypothetical protein [Flexivirga oryzae]
MGIESQPVDARSWGGSPAIGEAELRRLRHALGGATRPLATLDFWQDDDSWLMFSGVDNADYNLAMLGGQHASVQAERVLEAVERHGVPAMVFLPPGATSAGDVLAAAGWAHVRDVPFMRQYPRRSAHDPHARLLTIEDIPAARDCVTDAFAGPDSLGRALFNEAVLSRADAIAWGIFDPGGELVGCGLATIGPEAFSAWGMGVRRTARRSHAALSLTQLAFDLAARYDEARPILFNATDLGERLHLALGGEVLERWQLWTRRRWVLG